jgi:hypothetical protein
MKCTSEEVLLVLRGWYERNTPLLLDLQLTAGVEPIVIRGRITGLSPNHLLFSGLALSITVCFSRTTFEYEKMAKHDRKRATPDDLRCGVKLQLSPRLDTAFRDDLIQPKTTVSISEMAVY